MPGDADRVEFITPATTAIQEGTKVPDVKVEDKNGTQVVKLDTTKPPEKEAPKSERPQWLPEEFKTPEEMAAAWQKSKAEPSKNAEPKPGEKSDAVQKIEQAAKAGLDLKPYADEFAKDGKLSEESFGKLEKAGLSRQVVSSYIEGQKAQAAQYAQKLNDSVGGKENLEATLKWAAGALSAAEIAQANKAIESGDLTQASLVLSGLNARRVAESGVEPTRVKGQALRPGDVQGYESSAQMVADMNSKQYKADPAFRAKVMKKLAVSNF